MGHPGVWGQVYCCFYRDAVFTMKIAAATPAPPFRPSSPVIPIFIFLCGLHKAMVFPAKAGIHVPPTPGTAGYRQPTATPGVAEAHSRQSIKRIPSYSMLLRQLVGVQTQGTTWIPAFAGKTERITSSLQGLDDVAHLPERWATRSSSDVLDPGFRRKDGRGCGIPTGPV